MATQFVTLKKNDEKYNQYIWGTFSSTEKAIPVKTYNLGTAEESVTFEVKANTSIEKPSFIVFFASLIKVHSFSFILLPLFYVLVKNLIDDRFFDPLSVTLSAIASVFLFAGLNIRNDINDYISGYDRVNTSDASKKPIGKGWITAHRASVISWGFIFLSAILAFPVCLIQLELSRVLAVCAILFFLGQFAKQNSYKHQRIGEVVFFLLMGPALASGYQVSLGSGIDTEVLSFGVLWGALILFLLQVNNFAHIMTSSQAGVSNTITKLGFDRSQKYIVIFWTVIVGFWVLFHYFFGAIYWSVLGSIILIFWSLPFIAKILNIRSPMGSGLILIRQEAFKMYMIMMSLLLMEYLWALWDVSGYFRFLR